MRWLTNVLAWSVFALILFVFSPAALADKRVALVVGIGAYQHAPSLSNPTRDAKAIAEMFQKAGFDAVQARYDVGNLDFKRALREFLDEAKTADIAVVFFAGHGIQIGDQNYMIPVDAKLAREYDAKDEAISLERIVEAIEPAVRLRLVILDACRDNPFIARMQRRVATRAVAPGGLARVEPTFTDTLIAYAAKAGSTADDGNGDHSPFTAALLKHITEPGLDVRLAFGRIRDEVRKTTNDEQEPFVYGSLGGSNISLVPPPPVPKLDAFVQVKGDYELVERINSRKAWEVFINHHKEGMYVDLARERLRMLDSTTGPGEQRVASLPPATSPAGPTREQDEAWNRVKDSQDLAVVRRFIERNKSSPHVLAAQSLLENLEKAAREKEAAAETKRLTEEARKQAEAKRLAEERAAAEAKRAEEARKQAEAKRLAEERAAAEAKRLAEEARKQAEARKLTEEQAAAEARKLIEETRKNLEAKKLAEERAAAEAKRLAEEARKQAEAKKLAEDSAATAAERARRAEEAKKQAEAKKLAEERAAEVERVRKAEEARKQAEAKRIADEKAAAEAKRIAEENAAAEAKRIAAEAERVKKAEEKAAAEAQRLVAEKAAAEAKRVAEKAAADAERAKKAEEAQRLAEAKMRAEEQAAAKMKTVRLAQLELRRIGCFSGRDDGLLNQATKEAIDLYHSKLGKRSVKLDITDDFVEELKKREQRVCPLVCKDDQVAQGDQCIAKAAPREGREDQARAEAACEGGAEAGLKEPPRRRSAAPPAGGGTRQPRRWWRHHDRRRVLIADASLQPYGRLVWDVTLEPNRTGAHISRTRPRR